MVHSEQRSYPAIAEKQFRSDYKFCFWLQQKDESPRSLCGIEDACECRIFRMNVITNLYRAID